MDGNYLQTVLDTGQHSVEQSGLCDQRFVCSDAVETAEGASGRMRSSDEVLKLESEGDGPQNHRENHQVSMDARDEYQQLPVCGDGVTKGSDPIYNADQLITLNEPQTKIMQSDQSLIQPQSYQELPNNIMAEEYGLNNISMETDAVDAKENTRISLAMEIMNSFNPNYTENNNVDEPLRHHSEYAGEQQNSNKLAQNRLFQPDDELNSTSGEEDMQDLEPQSYDVEQGFRILREVMSETNKSVNWPFMNPVDIESLGLHDYNERIKKPMWLKKMKKKFEERVYETITEFAADFRLMLENCYRYNGPDHYISKRGQRLETMFEQKLTLLSRDLREKTSIAATSGQHVEEKVISGTRRRKVLVPHDSTALLNQLRMEEKEREKEARKQQMLEKQKEREEFEQTLQGWEDELLGDSVHDQLRSMWELPAIGHFLFLVSGPLNLGEVMHWELERCFAMPRESLTMQTIMTSLLSTPYQRTNLDKKPLMPYRVWEEKLRVRVRNWYKIFKECGQNMLKTMNKMGLEEKFFKVVGFKNPLKKKKVPTATLR